MLALLYTLYIYSVYLLLYTEFLFIHTEQLGCLFFFFPNLIWKLTASGIECCPNSD